MHVWYENYFLCSSLVSNRWDAMLLAGRLQVSRAVGLLWLALLTVSYTDTSYTHATQSAYTSSHCPLASGKWKEMPQGETATQAWLCETMATQSTQGSTYSNKTDIITQSGLPFSLHKPSADWNFCQRKINSLIIIILVKIIIYAFLNTFYNFRQFNCL